MQKLDDGEIANLLAKLPDWKVVDGLLRRTFVFPTFSQGIAFVVRLAEAAEAIRHHPDVDIRYNKITVVLTTHDAGGLTEKDFELANRADDLADNRTTDTEIRK